MLTTPAVWAQQSATDLSGKPIDPLADHAGGVVVMIFLRRDCPVSSRYAPTIQELGRRYGKAANFLLVFPDRSDAPEEIRTYIREYRYELPVALDPDHLLVKAAHAEITPEAAVFDRDHRLVYHGRIDDWYVSYGKSRPTPRTHELNDSIAAVLAGKPVSAGAVKGVGCYISDLK